MLSLIVSAAYSISAVVAFALSLLVHPENRPVWLCGPLGLLLVCVGTGLAVWALYYMRGEALSLIEPRKKHLITSGPYRFLRHPIYLGTLIALIGAAAFCCSLLGLVATLILFLPVMLWRTHEEEKALAKRFGAGWHDYRQCTGKFWPRPRGNIGKR